LTYRSIEANLCTPYGSPHTARHKHTLDIKTPLPHDHMNHHTHRPVAGQHKFQFYCRMVPR
jgi:hypothetical protein